MKKIRIKIEKPKKALIQSGAPVFTHNETKN